MNTQEKRAAEAAQRKRRNWIIFGTFGALLVGTPVLLSQCSPDEEVIVDPVVEGQAYENNYYVEGSGYYHAGFHTFYPYRFNHYDSAQGFYYGGSWHREADVTTRTVTSVPSRAAATSANSQFRASHPTSRSGFGRSSSSFASSSGSSSGS